MGGSSRTTCRRRLGACGVALLPWRDIPINRARSSAKVRDLIASGLPVVAYDIGELRETLGEGGVMSRRGTPRFLRGRSGPRLIRDPGLAARMGAAGQAQVLERYGWDKLVDLSRWTPTRPPSGPRAGSHEGALGAAARAMGGCRGLAGTDLLPFSPTEVAEPDRFPPGDTGCPGPLRRIRRAGGVAATGAFSRFGGVLAGGLGMGAGGPLRPRR